MCKISVIVPMYNREKEIRKMLRLDINAKHGGYGNTSNR